MTIVSFQKAKTHGPGCIFFFANYYATINWGGYAR